jgi:hypothetical protein
VPRGDGPSGGYWGIPCGTGDEAAVRGQRGASPLVRSARMVDANEELVSDTSEKLRGVEWSTDYADQLEDPHIEAVVPPPSSSPGPTRGLTGRGGARG